MPSQRCPHCDRNEVDAERHIQLIEEGKTIEDEEDMPCAEAVIRNYPCPYSKVMDEYYNQLAKKLGVPPLEEL